MLRIGHTGFSQFGFSLILLSVLFCYAACSNGENPPGEEAAGIIAESAGGLEWERPESKGAVDYDSFAYPGGAGFAVPIRNESEPPVVPETAKAESLAGSVSVKVAVGKDGVLHRIKILSENPKGYGFAQEAIEYLRRCEWTPAKQDGEPVDSIYVFAFNFPE